MIALAEKKERGIRSAARKKTSFQVEDWWQRFKKCNDIKARNRLLEHYLPIVKYTAIILHAKLPEEVDIDDLISAGIFGLIDAMKRFDLTRGVKFESYCRLGVRGAMLGELRRMDWVPRLVRSQAHKLDEAFQVLEPRLGRKPEEKELARHLRMSLKDFRKLQQDARAVRLVSLNREIFETDDHKDACMIDFLKDGGSDDPSLAAHQKEIKELVARGLSRTERLIIILYYFEEMPMKEIGATLELSESRVSQMHSAILDRLRYAFKKRQYEFTTV